MYQMNQYEDTSLTANPVSAYLMGKDVKEEGLLCGKLDDLLVISDSVILNGCVDWYGLPKVETETIFEMVQLRNFVQDIKYFVTKTQGFFPNSY